VTPSPIAQDDSGLPANDQTEAGPWVRLGELQVCYKREPGDPRLQLMRLTLDENSLRCDRSRSLALVRDRPQSEGTARSRWRCCTYALYGFRLGR
jgi:hypothetical protein